MKAMPPGEPGANFSPMADGGKGFYEALSQAPVGIICVALHQELLWTNTAFQQMLGYSAADLDRKSMSELIHPEDLEAVGAQCTRSFSGEIWQEISHRFKRSNGGVIWVRAHISLIRDSDGQPAYFVAMVVEDTARKQEDETLRQSEAQFRTLIESAPVAIGVSRHGLVLYANKKYRELFGFGEEENLRDQSILEHWAPSFREEIIARARNRFLGRDAPDEWEATALRNDGSMFPAHVSVGRVLLPEGPASLAFFADISERKQREEALRISEERFSLAFEYAAIGMALVAPNGQWLKVNRVLCNLIGYTSGELLTRTFQDITHPDDLETDLAFLRQLVAGEIPFYQMEKRYFHKQGRIVWIQLNVSLVRDAAHRPLYFVSQIQDITERKRAAEQIANQAALLDKAQDAIYERDLEGRIVYWNKGAERIFGWTREEAVGQMVTELMGVDPQVYEEATNAVLARGEWLGEVEESTKDQRKLMVEVRTTLLHDAAGKPKSVLCIKTDISEKKKLEAQFLRAQRMESIGTLASGIAHDLNNLLSPIMIGVDLLKLFGLPEASETVVADIERSAKRGSDLVQQILAFACGAQGARLPVDLGEVIDEIVLLIKPTLPQGVQVVTHIASPLLPVQADPTQLHQVLLNLCLNARDAMPEGGTLTLSVSDCPAALDGSPGVLIEVRDTGTGIPRENLTKIFDPFFTTKPLGKGTGLGLASVPGIIDSHGGTIQVDSKVGQGTTFLIHLPASAENFLFASVQKTMPGIL